MKMNLRSVFIILIIGAVYLHESEAGKLALIKAKVAIAKAPHIIAKVAVAKEVKAKAKIAAVKTFAAAKATKLAALSAITAPFRVAKKTIALKVGALKAAKAIKVAKIAKTAAILKNLKKSPIILPVPVAVPIKGFVKPLPAVAPVPSIFSLPAPSLQQSLGPIQGIISGAQKAIQSAGSIPILSTLTSSFGTLTEPKIVKEVPIVTPAPYRFVPEVGFTNYNKVSYQPQVEVEVPTVVSSYVAPSAVYGPPATTYGVPN